MPEFPLPSDSPPSPSPIERGVSPDTGEGTFPSGTVTFLFTDVEGSTRRWEADSPTMLDAVERHFVLLDEAIARHHGVRFKTIGDSIQAAFPTALDGALAAAEAQRAISKEDWGALGPLLVRMALHTGAANPRDGDYLAPSLNRLARLLATGSGGQVLVTEATRNLLRDALPRELELRDLGEHQLRDLRHAEHVFQLVASDLPTEFPALRSLTRQTNNLPAQLTSFVGREREIADVRQRLDDPTVRLLTLIGPGGTGKTRLALRVASDLLNDYPDGVWFVPLAPVTNPRLVASTIAETLGVREVPNQSIEESLRDFLRTKHLLLILDNFEHVAAAAPLLADLLASCPSLQIMATSRAPLRISGEHELFVPSLELPGDDASSHVAAEASAAVCLFVDRAKAVRASFALDEQNAATIVAICRRLDGLPLAIELAAARIRLLPLDAILERLDSRLTLLTGGGRDRPERQQTLRAAIAWSHDMLNAEEKALFRRLAVFVGGWSLEAAETIAAAAKPAVSALDCLATLIDNSLIEQRDPEATSRSNEVRFTMLQTIQEFAMAQLEESGELNAIRDAHADNFLQLATDAKPHLAGPSAASWLDRLDADHDNLRAALEWLRERGDAARAVSLAAALWRYWLHRGHIGEGRTQLEAALALSAPDNAAATRAEALDGAGVLAELQGDYDRAEELHQQSLAMSKELGDNSGVARALGNLGVVAFERGQMAQAENLIKQSLDLAQGAGNQELVANALNDLGRLAYQQGDLPRAESLYQQSLDIRRQAGNDSEIALSLNNLGLVAVNAGDFGRARRLLEESLNLSRAAGDRWVTAALLNALAMPVRLEGDLPRAIALNEESLALFQEVGDTKNAAVAMLNLAGATRENGDVMRALARYQEALPGFRDVDDRVGMTESLAWMGSILAGTGRFAPAARLLAAAARLAGTFDSGQDLVDTEQFTNDVAVARAALGNEPFSVAWKSGQALTIDEVISAAAEVSLSDRSR